MAKKERERGTIQIPRAEWARFKKTLREEFNKRQTHLYSEALRFRSAVIEQQKTGRPLEKIRQNLACGNFFIRLTDAEINRVISTVIKNDTLRRPLKKDFSMATTKTNHYDCEDGGIHLEAPHAVTWDVRETNHACERARKSHMARVFFAALSDITRRGAWTKNSGGEIVGYNEYNRDVDDSGDGGNYVTSRFGPEEQQQQRGQSFPLGFRQGGKH